MGVHDGHRDRLRASYLTGGFESMSEYTALEMLLFYAIPRRDTNGIAHALIDHFGDLDGVLNASVEQLEEVEGIGESTAILINCLRPLSRKASVLKTEKMRYLRSTKELRQYVASHFLHEPEEKFILLLLDARRGIICCNEMSRGTVTHTDLKMRKVLELAVVKRASFVVIAHNHPSGNPLPSVEDDSSTASLRTALHNVGIILEDHIIIAKNDYFSYKEHHRL